MKGVLLLLFCAGLLRPLRSSKPLELEEYPISLYHRDARLSTVLWFRPPYCLYELWAEHAQNFSEDTRKTAAIEMQVKLAGDAGVYRATQQFPLPICGPAMAQSLALGDHACEMGPVLACLNDTCIRAVLPGRMYSVKFLLYNQDRTLLAATGWSRHFRTREICWCDSLKMNRYHLLLCSLLIFRASYAIDDPAASASLPPFPSSFPTTWPVTPQSPPESTPDPESLLAPGPDTASPPDAALPQQNQTQPVFSTRLTPRARLSQEKAGRPPFKFPTNAERHAAGASQPGVAPAGGVEIVLMEPKGQLKMGEPQGAASHAMGLFLGVCGLLLCLFIGIYCTYSRGAKKEPFSHHRLYEDGFDDPALFLDDPKEYDWFFYETDGYVYPTPSQSHPKPIQTLSIPALKQPAPALETSPGKAEAPEATPDTKPPLPRLECLSPANLHTGNFI